METARWRAQSPRSPGAAVRLADLPPEVVGRVLGFLEDVGDLAAANAATRLFRGMPLEHALRERVRMRGHALPTAPSAGVRTWTEELFARERVSELARAHTHVLAAGGAASDFTFSAFVDAEGGLYACGEHRVCEASVWRIRCPTATGLCEQLGSPALVPTRVAALSGVRVRAVAAGSAHLLALSDAGAVYACGENWFGQLGVGDRTERRLFAPLPALRAEHVVGISAGIHHSLAHTAGGCAHSWGGNYRSQLGRAAADGLELEPRRVEGLGGVRVGGVAAGGYFTLLLSACGAVYWCGSAHARGAKQDQPTPTRIEALAAVRAVHVSAGLQQSLVVDAAGGVHSFGVGTAGVLGHGDESDQRAPKRIGALAGVHAVRACAGIDGSAVLCADGSVHTFGANQCGQLGVGQCTCHWVPQPVGALAHARVVGCSLGRAHALFLTADGGVHSCGKQSGALGHGVGLGTGMSALRAPTRVAQLAPLCSRALH